MSLSSAHTDSGPGKDVSLSPAEGPMASRKDRADPALDRNVVLCDCMVEIAAAMFNVCARELRKPGRSSLPISRIRQIAMYVCHVVFRLGMREIGSGFGRDRTTVMYACQVIEDMRDDDAFDIIVRAVERVAAVALRLCVLRVEAGR